MKIFKKVFYFAIIFYTLSVHAQKHVTAIRISSQPTIDGNLDEFFWKEISPAKDFVQYDPYNGKSATQKTEAFSHQDILPCILEAKKDNRIFNRYQNANI